MLIQARCGCGYASGIFPEGGGFANFTTIDMEPAYCAQCRNLVVVNYKDRDPVCPKCGARVIFYNDPSLRKPAPGREREREDIQWDTFRLPDAEYLCPRCGGMSLRFRVTGTWD